MKKLVSVLVAFAVAAFIAVPAQAQQGTWEIGMDGGLLFSSYDIDGMDSTLDFSLPFQALRVGVFITPQISIEPTFGFDRMDFGDDDTVTALTFHTFGLIHFSPDRTRSQFFVGAGGGLDYVSFGFDGESESDTQWSAGLGAGVKVPFRSNVSLRLSGAYLRGFESDFMPDVNRVRGSVGLSFFLD
jgi:hypothetical protein